MLPAWASSGMALLTVSGAFAGVCSCPGVCPAALPCFLLEAGFSAGEMMCAMEGGAVTQFAKVVSAGCMTCIPGIVRMCVLCGTRIQSVHRLV